MRLSDEQLVALGEYAREAIRGPWFYEGAQGGSDYRVTTNRPSASNKYRNKIARASVCSVYDGAAKDHAQGSATARMIAMLYPRVVARLVAEVRAYRAADDDGLQTRAIEALDDLEPEVEEAPWELSEGPLSPARARRVEREREHRASQLPPPVEVIG